MKLTIDQALKIRNEFRYLEGELVNTRGSDLQIDRIIVSPEYSPDFNKFIQKYYQDNWDELGNEEALAMTFNPNSYYVITLYYELGSILVYEPIFKTLNKLKVKIDYRKYGLDESDLESHDK